MNTLNAAPFRISESPAPVELLGKYFRGLGDPTRLRLLELLGDDEEFSVSELVERVGVAQPTVSKHLGCLRWCGFVVSRREHRTVYYRLADPRVSELLGIGRALLADNAEHVAACGVIEETPC